MIQHGFADTEQVRFHYARMGSGPPVVLLSGAGGWRLTFDALAAHLSARRTVYALDPPGQGETRVLDPAFGFDTDAIAHSIGDFLDTVGMSAPAIVGHSWGGGFALRFAELHPYRVDRLALLAPAGIDVRDVWEFRLLRLPLIGEISTRLTSTSSVRHMMRKSFTHQERIPRHLLVDVAQAMRSGPHAAALRRDMLRLERTVRWTDTERDLDQVSCPTLILWGDSDRYFPVHQVERLTSRLTAAEVHVLPGCGHSLHDDCPDQTYPLLSRFLATDEPLSPLDAPQDGPHD